MHRRYIDTRIVSRHDIAAHFGQCPGNLEAGSSAAYDYNVQQGIPLLFRGSDHGLFQVAQYGIADTQCVANIGHRPRTLFDVIHAEKVRHASRCDHQVIISN